MLLLLNPGRLSLLRPLLATSPFGDLSSTVHLTDDVREAVRVLTAG